MLSKIKGFKNGYSRKRAKPDRDLPYPRVRSRGKWVRRSVKLVLLLVAVSGVGAFIKAGNVSQTNHKLEARIATYEDKLKKASMGQSVYSPSLNNYMNDFFGIYFTGAKDDKSARERLKQLKKYFATNIDETQLANRQDQKYAGYRLLNTFTQDDVKIAQYQVGYTIGDNKDIISRVYNVPFAQKSGQYTVLSLPYATAKQDIVGHVAKLPNDNENDSSLSGNEKIRKFVKAFSDKYVSSKASDMSLIMRDPEALDGQYTVKSINHMTVSGKKSKMTVRYLLTLIDRDTQFEHSEQVTLTISPKGNTYYVEKISHLQGGLLGG